MLRRGNIPRAPFSRERPGNPGGGSVGGTPPPPPQSHRSNQPRGPASPVSVSVGEAAPPQHGGDLGTHVRPRRPPALSRKRGGDGASATVARGQRHARRALLRGPSPARAVPFSPGDGSRAAAARALPWRRAATLAQVPWETSGWHVCVLQLRRGETLTSPRRDALGGGRGWWAWRGRGRPVFLLILPCPVARARRVEGVRGMRAPSRERPPPTLQDQSPRPGS